MEQFLAVLKEWWFVIAGVAAAIAWGVKLVVDRKKKPDAPTISATSDSIAVGTMSGGTISKNGSPPPEHKG